MPRFEDVADGVFVYGGGLPSIYETTYDEVVADNPNLTAEEAFRQTCVCVGNLVARSETPAQVA